MKSWVMAFGLVLFSLALGEEKKNINLFTAIDFGRVESGYDTILSYDPKGMFLNRTYVDVAFNDQLDENFLISIGVGGIFWKSYEGSGGAGEKRIQFGPGISNAYMKWLMTSQLDLTFGYFQYKYNESATNLGEYLFRTEAYPTNIFTGGWSWMNDVQYRTVGAKLTWNLGEGKFKQDIGLFGEYFNAPIYDITPAYIATYKPAEWLTLGGAVSLHRYISSSRVKKDANKSYRYYEHVYVAAIAEDTANKIKAQPAKYVNVLEDDITTVAPGALEDTVNNKGLQVKTVSFSLSAIKALAFFDLNLNALLGLSQESMGKFNLYGEIAQLGFKNYPIFFTNSAQRRPIMVGFSVPTFGLLEHLSFEFEHLNNPIVESISGVYEKIEVVPHDIYRYQVFNKDNFKWSVHAARPLTKFMTLYVQAANDHLRLKDGHGTTQYIPIMSEASHWYWLTRLQWMI